MDRLKRLLREYPAQEIAPRLTVKAEDPLLASTLHLLELLKAGKQSPEEFLRSFAETLIAATQHGDMANDLASDVLFGKLFKKGTCEPWECILFIDLEDLSPFSTAVADADSAGAWSEALLLPTDQSEADVVQCALDAQFGSTIGDKMPNPNFPLLGGTYLISMNSEIPCQSRYGRSSTSLFPVTRHAAQGVHDALLHTTTKNLEGKTWNAVASGTGDRKDFLIAYIEEAPETDAPVAGTLGSAYDDDEDGEIEETSSSAQMSSFIQRLDRLLEAIQLKEREVVRGARHLQLFVLSTIDKGRKQVPFNARYNVGNIVDARDRWVAGAENSPALDLQFFQGKARTKRSGVAYRPPLQLPSRSALEPCGFGGPNAAKR